MEIHRIFVNVFLLFQVKKDITMNCRVKIISLAQMKQEHIFYNTKCEKMAPGSLHPERTSFHAQNVDIDHIVVSIEEVFPNELGLYPDPMEEDYDLYLGMFALWRKDLVDLPPDVTAEGSSTAATETSTALGLVTTIPAPDISAESSPYEATETSTAKGPPTMPSLDFSPEAAETSTEGSREAIEIETAPG